MTTTTKNDELLDFHIRKLKSFNKDFPDISRPIIMF